MQNSPLAFTATLQLSLLPTSMHIDTVTCYLVCDQGALLSSAALTRPPSICIPQPGTCNTTKSGSICARALSCLQLTHGHGPIVLHGLLCTERSELINNAALKQSQHIYVY